MPVIDVDGVPERTGSIYPEPWAAQMGRRSSRRLGAAGGLTQFGVNLVTIQPGGLSSLRHWHHNEDEFVWMVAGELILVQDAGETVMRPGMAAAFPAGDPDGHHFANRSDRPATFLVVGTDAPVETGVYSDLDLIYRREGDRTWFTRRDGTLVKEVK